IAGDAAATAGSSGQGWLTTSTVANPPSGSSKTHPAPERAQPSWPSTSFAHPPKGQRSSELVTSSRSGLPEKSTATHCVKENLSTGRAYTRFFARWRPNQRVRRARDSSRSDSSGPISVNEMPILPRTCRHASPGALQATRPADGTPTSEERPGGERSELLG